jgi:hypothetical protein
VSSDVVHQVRINHATRTLGDGFLVAPGFVITTAAVVRDVGPGVSLSVRGLPDGPGSPDGRGLPDGPGSPDGPGVKGAEGSGIGDTGVAAPVAAEVVEVLGSDELALLEVAPGFVVPAGARPIPAAELSFPAGTPADQLLRFRRFGAAHLRAELEGRKMGGAQAREGEGSGAQTASERAGDTQRTTNSAGERGALLLAYLRERARTGRLDPLVTVPALEWSR